MNGTRAEVAVEEFFTSWTFLFLMAGLLCFLVLLIPVGVVLAVVFVNRANRDNRELRD